MTVTLKPSRCFSYVTAIVLLGAMAASAQAGWFSRSQYWDWGAGYYQRIESDNPVDEARWDWAVLSVANTGLTEEYIKTRLNRMLELNPRQKYQIELSPCNHHGKPHRYSSMVTMFDYRFRPEAKQAVIEETRREVRMILDNIAKPENVVGFSLLEELPGHWGCGDQIAYAADQSKLPPILAEFKPQIEAERGKPLVWDDETRLWVGRLFTETLAEMHRLIKQESGGKPVVYWHHGGYSFLDEIGHTLPAATPLATQALYPARFKDIVLPGLVDMLMGWPEHPERNRRTIWLAEYLDRPFFMQLSHPSFMRLNRWEECLANAKAKHPLKLGYFFYCEGSCNSGAWNDDPATPGTAAANIPYVSRAEHARRFCAREGIGTEVVERAMAPTVEARITLGQAKPGDIPPLTLLLHNPATPEFFTTPEQAVCRNLRVTIKLPAGCRLESRYSIPATVLVGDLAPGSWKTVEWWVTVDQTPAAGKAAVTRIRLDSDNRPAVVREFTGDSAIPAFAEHGICRSGTAWAESTFGRAVTVPAVTFESLAAIVKNPAVSDGTVAFGFQGALSPGRKLQLTPDGKGRLLPAPLLAAEDFSPADSTDPTGYRPFSDGYTVTGKYLARELGDVKKLRVTISGKTADGAMSQVCCSFTTAAGLKDVIFLHHALGPEWGRAEAEIEVPAGAIRLERVHLYRAGNKGKIWYGPLEITAADLPADGIDVSDRVNGVPLQIPGNSFRVITYTDENPPAARPRVRVQLQADMTKGQ